MPTAQDVLIKDLFDEEESQPQQNETLEILEFMKTNGVPLTSDQVKASFILKENGLSDIADFAVRAKPAVTPYKRFFELVNKLTMADRIKGNAKLSSILKANANPANAPQPNPKDYQAKMLRESELR
ncbi:hypothetical protein CHH59_21475 [Shouchella clausii]|uniref:Uncharacterized protein n=1 Tax=Shouchella clausii TaxID=79880 RepID=A0A268NT52_SHOCL|nr:hypothetical protein [Shouchella clausii]PAE86656.1 hypothetical protein CHH72_22355 [Shouchella clausii]PAF11842.1 hypothetical protein CHH59_21475 [Shouchella clausii]